MSASVNAWPARAAVRMVCGASGGVGAASLNTARGRPHGRRAPALGAGAGLALALLALMSLLAPMAPTASPPSTASRAQHAAIGGNGEPEPAYQRSGRANPRLSENRRMCGVMPDRSRSQAASHRRAPAANRSARSLPAASVARASSNEMRPRRLRIHMIRRHRRHTAPIIDARPHQAVERLRLQVRRRLNRHALPEQQASHGDSPELFLQDPARVPFAILVPGLARKFWMMISCRLPCAS